MVIHGRCECGCQFTNRTITQLNDGITSRCEELKFSLLGCLTLSGLPQMEELTNSSWWFYDGSSFSFNEAAHFVDMKRIQIKFLPLLTLIGQCNVPCSVTSYYVNVADMIFSLTDRFLKLSPTDTSGSCYLEKAVIVAPTGKNTWSVASLVPNCSHCSYTMSLLWVSMLGTTQFKVADVIALVNKWRWNISDGKREFSFTAIYCLCCSLAWVELSLFQWQAPSCLWWLIGW